jgi:hypothetical protein
MAGDNDCPICGKNLNLVGKVHNCTPMVVHAPIGSSLVVHAGSSRHGQYADPEKRRAYRAQWARNKRAEG